MAEMALPGSWHWDGWRIPTNRSGQMAHRNPWFTFIELPWFTVIYLSTMAIFGSFFYWLVISTPLKNISQWEGLSQILWKIIMENKKCSKPPTSHHLFSQSSTSSSKCVRSWLYEQVSCLFVATEVSRSSKRSHGSRVNFIISWYFIGFDPQFLMVWL